MINAEELIKLADKRKKELKGNRDTTNDILVDEVLYQLGYDRRRDTQLRRIYDSEMDWKLLDGAATLLEIRTIGYEDNEKPEEIQRAKEEALKDSSSMLMVTDGLCSTIYLLDFESKSYIEKAKINIVKGINIDTLNLLEKGELSNSTIYSKIESVTKSTRDLIWDNIDSIVKAISTIIGIDNLEDIKESFKSLTETLANSDNDTTELEQKIRSLVEEAEELRETADKAKLEAEELKIENNELNEKIQELEEKASHSSSSIPREIQEEYVSKIQSLSNDLAEAQQNNRELKAKISEQEEKLDNTYEKREARALEKLNSDVKDEGIRRFAFVINENVYEEVNRERFVGKVLSLLFELKGFQAHPFLFNSNYFKITNEAVRHDIIIGNKTFDVLLDGVSNDDIMAKLKMIFASFNDVIFACKIVGNEEAPVKKVSLEKEPLEHNSLNNEANNWSEQSFENNEVAENNISEAEFVEDNSYENNENTYENQWSEQVEENSTANYENAGAEETEWSEQSEEAYGNESNSNEVWSEQAEEDGTANAENEVANGEVETSEAESNIAFEEEAPAEETEWTEQSEENSTANAENEEANAEVDGASKDVVANAENEEANDEEVESINLMSDEIFDEIDTDNEKPIFIVGQMLDIDNLIWFNQEENCKLEFKEVKYIGTNDVTFKINVTNKISYNEILSKCIDAIIAIEMNRGNSNIIYNLKHIELSEISSCLKVVTRETLNNPRVTCTNYCIKDVTGIPQAVEILHNICDKCNIQTDDMFIYFDVVTDSEFISENYSFDENEVILEDNVNFYSNKEETVSSNTILKGDMLNNLIITKSSLVAHQAIFRGIAAIKTRYLNIEVRNNEDIKYIISQMLNTYVANTNQLPDFNRLGRILGENKMFISTNIGDVNINSWSLNLNNTEVYISELKMYNIALMLIKLHTFLFRDGAIAIKAFVSEDAIEFYTNSFITSEPSLSISIGSLINYIMNNRER